MDELALEMLKAAGEGAGREGINKIANFAGGLFPYFGLTKKAISTFVSDIENSNLPPEIKMYEIANAKKKLKQIKNQAAVANIAQNVAKEGTDFSEYSGVDEEWLDRYMDSSKHVSDEEVQLVWGNILAKEFESPGSTPPSVMRILSELTPSYAKIFHTLCNLRIDIIPLSKDDTAASTQRRIILPTNYDYLDKYGINFSTLNELHMLGLIQLDNIGNYVIRIDTTEHPQLIVAYGKNAKKVKQYRNKEFPLGCVLLTKAGMTISQFVEPYEIDGHFDAVCDFLMQKKVVFDDKADVELINRMCPAL